MSSCARRTAGSCLGVCSSEEVHMPDKLLGQRFDWTHGAPERWLLRMRVRTRYFRHASHDRHDSGVQPGGHRNGVVGTRANGKIERLTKWRRVFGMRRPHASPDHGRSIPAGAARRARSGDRTAADHSPAASAHAEPGAEYRAAVGGRRHETYRPHAATNRPISSGETRRAETGSAQKVRRSI